MDPLPTFNWVFEYQPIASGILTQPSSLYKRAETNLLSDEKGPQNSIKKDIYCYISVLKHLLSQININVNLVVKYKSDPKSRNSYCKKSNHVPGKK